MDKENEIISEFISSVKKIKYGEIIITIHNSKVVQIETREKRRFDMGPTAKAEVERLKNPSPTR